MTWYQINCEECHKPLGYQHGGDVYLPLVVCPDCHDDLLREPEEIA